MPEHGGAGIPVTYVPARNTVFLSLALGVGRSARCRQDRHRRQSRRLFGLSRLPARVHRGVPSVSRALATKRGVEGGTLVDRRAARARCRKPTSFAAASSSASNYSLTVSCYQADDRRPRVRPLRLVPAAPAKASRPPASPIRRVTLEPAGGRRSSNGARASSRPCSRRASSRPCGCRSPVSTSQIVVELVAGLHAALARTAAASIARNLDRRARHRGRGACEREHAARRASRGTP